MAIRSMRTVGAAHVTPVEFHILLAVVDADRHGYAIMQQVIVESNGTVQLGPGTLYGAIKRLLEYGYIREVRSRVDPALDDTRRRYYRLTAEGRTALAAEVERLGKLVKLARSKRLVGSPSAVKGGRS